MTQSEKIKIVLKKAYEIYSSASHKTREYYDLVDILEKNDMIVDYQEVLNIGKRLEGDGLFNFALRYGKTGHPHIQFTSYGLDFYENYLLHDMDTPIGDIIEAEKTANKAEKINVPHADAAKGPSPLNLILLLIEIQILVRSAKDIPEDLCQELFERIDELSIYINVTQKIPKRALMDFINTLQYMRQMDKFLPELKDFLPQ
jgi:hypothetical protein